MQVKKVLFTFDYELFLGKRSGTVERCLLRPTQSVLEILEEYKAKGVFFVDTAYLCRLKKAAAEHTAAASDLERIGNQLREMARNHYVCPHIHPHWLDAVYLAGSNQWDLSDISQYRFHKTSDSNKAELFRQSLEIIRELAGDPLCKVDAYRAGGWCIQPFEDFRTYFEMYGIVNDFSVLPGMRNFSDAQYYDFSSAPAAPVYHFENDPAQEAATGRFCEFAISTHALSPVRRLAGKFMLKYLWKTGNRSSGDGLSVALPSSGSETVSAQEMISIELLDRVKLGAYLRFFREHDFMHFISHPKMLSPHNLSMFRKFMKRIHAENKIESDYHNMVVV